MILAGLMAVIAWCVIRPPRATAPPNAIVMLWLCSVSACFSIWLAEDPGLVFAAPNAGLHILRTCLTIAVAAAVGLWLGAVLGARRHFMQAIAMAFVIVVLCARAFVIYASPHPIIDVYDLTAQA